MVHLAIIQHATFKSTGYGEVSTAGTDADCSGALQARPGVGLRNNRVSVACICHHAQLLLSVFKDTVY